MTRRTYLALAAAMTSTLGCAMEPPAPGGVDEIGAAHLALAACGDGNLDPGEQCDDGNTNNGDFCASDCSSGIDTTGTNCSTAALLSLIQPSPVVLTGFGPTVDLPTNARIRLCDHDSDGVMLPITHRVRIRGNGTQLLVADDELHDVFVIEGNPPYNTAERTVIENLEIRFEVPPPNAVPTVDHEAVAVRVETAQVVLRDLMIMQPGTGILARATSGMNLNLQRWDNIMVSGCRRVGVHLEGLDVSSGVISGLSISACHDPREGHDAVGLFEASANGNTHIGHNLEVNDVSLRVNPAGGLAPSTFVGVYIEEGDPVEWLGNYSRNTTTVGGHLVALPATGGDRFGVGNSYTTFRNSDSTGTQYAVQIPAGQWHSAMLWRRYDSPGSNNVWLLHADTTAPAGTHRWGFRHYLSAQDPLEVEVVDTNYGSSPPAWQTDVVVQQESLCDYGTNQCTW